MGSDKQAQAAAIYVCDLAEGLSKEDLWQVFANYGEIASVEQVNGGGSDAVVIEYAEQQAAEEARGMLNYAALRGKTCRCLAAGTLEVIRQTMDTGQRLVFERLDPEIDSCGLRDVCRLFGEVLDCKVQVDEEQSSRGLGFAHFSREEEAAKATLFLDGMQLGGSTVEVRPFEPADIVLFSGCLYTSTASGSHARKPAPDVPRDGEDANEPHPVPGGMLEEGDESQPAACTPEDMERSVLQRFRMLEVHHLEVLEDLESKLERLKKLIQLYDPSHETQMVVVAQPVHVQPVAGILGECLEDCDYESLELSTSKEDRKAIIEGYGTGNLYVVTASSEVCARSEFDLGRPASVLINFDCAPTVQLHLRRIFKRTDSSTRVHTFFSPTTDSKLALPLLKALEEAGHEIPPKLLEMWSKMDQKAGAAGTS
uniref:RRM domain-containing protein n=1 Tax=Pyrodinium bahamense TaxID=73915 RepID=A0A7S0AFQ5_9DINO